MQLLQILHVIQAFKKKYINKSLNFLVTSKLVNHRIENRHVKKPHHIYFGHYVHLTMDSF